MNASPGPSSEAISVLCEGTPYRVEQFLGRGGMGEVWTVRHEFLGREFALKALHARFSAKPKAIDRLRLEAQVTALLEHPNIVPVVDFWISRGRACLVMELLTGRTLLAELRQRKRLPPSEVAEIGCQILSALVAAHRRNVIHRDIKPENVFLDEVAGLGRRVRVLDFGVARVVRDSANHDLVPAVEKTRTGTIIGSPRYMSPEAMRGEPLDPRADVFSVGVTLYELLTGTGPFDFMPQPEEATPPTSLAEGVPSPFDDILLRALRKNASERFPTAEEFEANLRPLLPSRPGRR